MLNAQPTSLSPWVLLLWFVSVQVMDLQDTWDCQGPTQGSASQGWLAMVDQPHLEQQPWQQASSMCPTHT